MLDILTIMELLFMGVLLGTVYAPLVLGFNIIYKSSKVVNFAQGEMLMVGAYIAYTFYTLTAPNIFLGLFLAIAFSPLVGLIVERFILRPLIARSVFAVIMVTICLGSVFQGLTQVIWSPIPLSVPRIFPIEPIRIGGISVPTVYVGSAAISALLIIVLMLLYHKTRFGISMRAAAADQEAALSMGVNVKMVFALAWMLSAIASTIAGILLSNIYGFVSQAVLFIGLRVLTAAIVGGLDSVPGAVVGAMLIGVIESVGGILEPFVAPGFKQVFPLIFVLIFLIFKPYGLFGTERIKRI